jgi:hypothetical protein
MTNKAPHAGSSSRVRAAQSLPPARSSFVLQVLTHMPIGPCRLRLRDPHMPGETLSIAWPDRAGIAYPAGADQPFRSPSPRD